MELHRLNIGGRGCEQKIPGIGGAALRRGPKKLRSQERRIQVEWRQNRMWGGGESLHPENQVATPSASPKEKTRPARFENSSMENSADGTVVGRKEGAVSKVGNESFNAEDLEWEVLGDMLETTKQKEQRQVAVDEVNIPITQGSFGDFNCQSHKGTHVTSPSPSGPHIEGPLLAHIKPNSDLEENMVAGTEMGPFHQNYQPADSPSMQIDVAEKKVLKVASRTWQRKAREPSVESSTLQGGKRKNLDSISLDLDTQGSEKKKSKSNSVALAEAGSQPHPPQ
jgi:hypothetical protein